MSGFSVAPSRRGLEHEAALPKHPTSVPRHRGDSHSLLKMGRFSDQERNYVIYRLWLTMALLIAPLRHSKCRDVAMLYLVVVG